MVINCICTYIEQLIGIQIQRLKSYPKYENMTNETEGSSNCLHHHGTSSPDLEVVVNGICLSIVFYFLQKEISNHTKLNILSI